MFEPIDLSLAQRLTKTPEPQEFLAKMFAALRQGHICLHEEGDIPTLPSDLVIQNGPYYYFPRQWHEETTFLNSVKSIINHPAQLITPDLQDLSLTSEQAQAIELACKSSLFILTGGPGTGKTYTAGQFLRLFVQQQDCEIALAAPTGKAAANLQKALGKYCTVQPKTLHSLLKEPLSADLILVDECSMIDATMMMRLFSYIKPGARLILLGDRHQLPPVESGGFFGDLVDILQDHVVELTQCLRTDLKEIVACAQWIKEGNAQECLELLESGSKALSWKPLEEFNASEITQSTLLSPLKVGPYGVDALNEKIAKRFHKQTTQPIMIIKNHERLQLFNGEVGTLVKQHTEISVGDYALFGEKRIPALLLPPFAPAYCLSVHKSQGSEFDHISLVLPEGSERFGREVLYTAVTRAKKSLTIYASKQTLELTLNNHFKRRSGIVYRWSNIIEPQMHADKHR